MFGNQRSQFNRTDPRPMAGDPTKRQEGVFAYQKENLQLMNPILAGNLSKPLISPRKQQQSERMMADHNLTQRSQNFKQHRSPQTGGYTERAGQGWVCCNHPSKKAQFRTSLEDCEEYFCGRCAAQLATQGLKVQMLSSTGSQGMRVSKKNDIPCLPQYQSQPIYHQIVDILKLCNTVVEEHTTNIEVFSRLDEDYSQQADLTSAFYDRLIQIIQEMKTDHLSDLMQERDKYTQIADIQNDNLRENIIEVNVIKNDIENHMEEVIEGIQASGDTAECRESLDHYRQKLTLFRHQTEEQLDSLSQTTRYSQQKIDGMLDSFERFMNDLWHEEGTEQTEVREERMPLRQLNSAMTVKNIHQILPRGVGYEGDKGAFRNLQAEEQEEMEDRKSPNFKRI